MEINFIFSVPSFIGPVNLNIVIRSIEPTIEGISRAYKDARMVAYKNTWLGGTPEFKDYRVKNG